MDKNSASDKWTKFFSAMADGLLPYLHLYVQRNQRGRGLGNFLGSRRRHQVPVVVNGAALLGRGTVSGANVRSMQLVSPTQQQVQQAKSIMDREDQSFQELTDSTIKHKNTSTRAQSKPKRQRVEKQLSKIGLPAVKQRAKLSGKKKNSSKKRKHPRSNGIDIFDRNGRLKY